VDALVIGSEGFLGRRLCALLKAMGCQLACVDPRLNCSFQAWPQRSQPYDYVLHLGANILDVDARSRAGVAAYKDILLDYEVLRYTERCPPKQALLAMSSCAVDFPQDPYGWCKLTLEAMASKLRGKCRVAIVRPFSGYGSDQPLSYPFPALLARALRREDPLAVWGGDQVRDWLHVDDLAEGVLHALLHAPTCTPVDVGTGVGTPLKTLARPIAAAVGYEPVLASDHGRAVGSPRRVADTRAMAALGWRAKVTLAEGIRRCIDDCSSGGT
jgi:nucleoside-diphosphate-sugar epimerase